MFYISQCYCKCNDNFSSNIFEIDLCGTHSFAVDYISLKYIQQFLFLSSIILLAYALEIFLEFLLRLNHL